MDKVNGSADWAAAGWDEFFRRQRGSWRAKDYYYLNDVFNLTKLRGSLLDVGCALGDGQLMLYNACPKVDSFSACDFSQQAIDTCCQNQHMRKTKFFCHNLLEPFPRQYDNVICLQSLEHVTDPTLSFRNLHAATRKALLVSTPYKNHRPDANHLWSFDEKDFAEFGATHVLGQGGGNIYWLIAKAGALEFRGRIDVWRILMLRKVKNSIRRRVLSKGPIGR